MKTCWAITLTLGCICATSASLAGKVEDTFRQTSALTSNGVVSLQNVNGKVRITTWEKAEVQIHAVKRAARQSDLDAVSIEVDTKPGRVRIETKYPRFRWGRSNSTTVDYEIKVPAQARLNDIITVNGDIEVDGVESTVRAITVNGQVVLKGLRAEARLESVNGDLKAFFEQFDDVDLVSLKSVNGKIQVSLPAHANATVSANTLNGSIRTDPALAVKRHVVGTDVHGNLGKGGATIRAETINGSIGILSAESPGDARDHTAPSKPKLEED